ncbi:MAG: hypothetical protein ACYDIE_10715 [Candidatus Krumholzibacteriia bacterium]
MNAPRPQPAASPASAALVAAAGPPPDTLPADDDLLLAELAVAVQRRGLATPAVLWLESLRPLSFIGAQAMHALTPFVQLLTSGARFERLAVIFEERGHLERFLRLIETAAALPPAPAKDPQ